MTTENTAQQTTTGSTSKQTTPPISPVEREIRRIVIRTLMELGIPPNSTMIPQNIRLQDAQGKQTATA